MEIRHAGTAQHGQRLRRLGREERSQRLAGAGALDDRAHRHLRLRARGRAEHREHEIEFGRGQQDVERRLHGVVARARDREIDQPRRLDLDARGGEARERRVARALDRDAAARQRIDHHGGAARRGGEHADRACTLRVAALAARFARQRGGHRRGHARQQRQPFDQRVERIDPRDAAFGEKHVGDVVLAGERAGVGDRELARRRRTAELVGQHRLAARCRRERKAPQACGMAHGFQEQHVAVDAGVIERRLADVAEREIDLVADRDQAGEADAARLAAGEQRADHAARMGGGEDAADRQLLLVEGGVRRQHRLAAQVDDAQARRPDQPQPSARAHLAQPLLARQSLRADLCETIRQHGRDLDAQLSAFHHGFNGSFGRRHHIDVLGRLGQRGKRRPGALPEHRLAPRVDRIDASRVAHLAQKFQRPSGGLAGVVRLADDGDGARREQRLLEPLRRPLHYACNARTHKWPRWPLASLASAARKRSRQNEASKLRLNSAGSVGRTRTATKLVPLPSRSRRAPSAMSASVDDRPGALDAGAGRHLLEVGAQAGMAFLPAGLAVVAVVDAQDREIGGVHHRDGGERADVHQQLAVAGDDQHALVRARQREA